MIKLYQFPHSPFCIPARLILKAANIPFQVRNVSNADRSEIITLTDGAYYQVPVLVDDRAERRVIFESTPSSQDVARYLDSEFTGGRLFPARVDGLQDLMIQHLEEEVESLTFKLQDPFYIDSISDLVERTMIIRHKERKFGKGCLQQWKREHSQLMKEAEVLLHPYEKMLQHSDFLLSDQPVYSDFLLAGILGNITFHGYVSIPESLPRLRELPDRLEVHLLQ